MNTVAAKSEVFIECTVVIPAGIFPGRTIGNSAKRTKDHYQDTDRNVTLRVWNCI